jgi:hypothetical protein
MKTTHLSDALTDRGGAIILRGFDHCPCGSFGSCNAPEQRLQVKKKMPIALEKWTTVCVTRLSCQTVTRHPGLDHFPCPPGGGMVARRMTINRARARSTKAFRAPTIMGRHDCN